MKNFTALLPLMLIPICGVHTRIQAQENQKQPEAELEIIRQQQLEKEKAENQSKDDWWFGLHDTISTSVYDTASWFDGFFANNANSDLTPQTSARIRLGWEPRARDLGVFDTRFRLKVKLPHLANRVDLIFTDDADDELSKLPLESSKSSVIDNKESVTASVRFIHKNDQKRFFDSRVGASGGDLFIKSRYKRQFQVSEKGTFKVEPSVFYFLKDGFGERLLLQYEYQQQPDVQYRLTYSIQGSQSFSGIRWKHGIYRLRQINDATASALGVVVNGERNGQDGFFVDNYSLNYRYRFNGVREWLYFEIEPFIEWPKENDYKATPGIALRVEGFFNKN